MTAPSEVPARLPMAVCAAVAELLRGSHGTLEDLFMRGGAKGPPPDLPHQTKWKTWLYESGKDPEVDSLRLLGLLIEEFMDLPPVDAGDSFAAILGESVDQVAVWRRRRERIVLVLKQAGLQYFSGGRIMPLGDSRETASSSQSPVDNATGPRKPETVEELLRHILRGLPRAMHPLSHRRAAVPSLSFESEYDIQDLLHSQLRPWIADIRPEEYTPSYAGRSTRMDFLLPEHGLVLEVKRVRSRDHAKSVGQELTIDREHYRKHPACVRLWCVIYDPNSYLQNPAGLVSDLKGRHIGPDNRAIDVEVFVFGPPL